VDEQSARTLRVAVVPAAGGTAEPIGEILARLGHTVVELDVVGGAVACEDADVAIAAVALVSADSLELLERIVDDAICPVIAVLHAGTPDYVRAAATLGVFAVVDTQGPEDVASAIDVTLQRFAAYSALHGAGAAVEQARGILMVYHAIEADQALELLRGHAERAGETLLDAAAAVVSAHPLLARRPPPD
jgi:AmiR/NasT family two-component response regulator